MDRSYICYHRLDLLSGGFSFLVILSNSKVLPNFLYCFSATLVCFFNSWPNGKYSNIFIVAAFSSKSFSGKTSLPVKKSYLLTFPDDKAEILAVFLSKSY